MSMGKREGKQQALWVGAGELPRSPGHRFYEKLNELLREADFDRKVEAICQRFYEKDGTVGRPSIAPGVYFRMLFIGYFEGIESERGIEWRCADSLSLRDFLGLMTQERVPDHSSLSRIRTRLDSTVYDEVFRTVLAIVESKGLLRGRVAGVDSTYLRADASMKAIVRKDSGLTYQEYLKKLCEEQGIENPTAEECRRVDRKRKGKRTSNKDWASKTDADARVMRLKDGRTRLAYKAEHVVDMETGAVIAAEIHEATEGDTATIAPNLEQARANLAAVNPTDADETTDSSSDEEPPSAPPSSSRSVMEVVADKGYHKAELLRDLKRAQYRTYISVPKQKGLHHWKTKGGLYTEQAFRGNQTRVRRDKGRALMRLRGELIERTFAHACETGGHRRVRLRGRANVRKRYLGQVAAMNLGLVLRTLLGSGTPRGLAAARKGLGLVFEVVTAVMAAVVTWIAAIRLALGRRSLAALERWGDGSAAVAA
jgi:transposase